MINLDNILTMQCVAIEDRDGYYMVYFHIVSNYETNKYRTTADGMVAFAVMAEYVSEFTIDKFYDLALKEIVVSE